jgi:hypothetical protein
MQLNKTLPIYSNRFSNSIALNSITSSGTIATVTTSAPHNLQTGNVVAISGATHPTVINSMNRNNTIITVVTDTDHDLTENFQDTVNISGATESEFNGDFKLLKVPNRRTFTLETSDSGATVATGSPILNEETGFGYNGLKVITEIDSTNFSYELEKSLGSPANISNSNLANGFRITGANDLQSCVDLYTNKSYTDSWAFVVLGTTVASKNKRVETDAIYVSTGNTRFQQELIQNFTVFVMSTVSNQVTSRPIRDEMEDVATALYKSLVGVKFPNYLSSKNYFKTVFDNHEMVDYKKSLYAHAFNFQTCSTLVDTDINNENLNVAFRDIDLIQSQSENEDVIKLTANIDLDEDELP